jgi:hypothetical protein
MPYRKIRFREFVGKNNREDKWELQSGYDPISPRPSELVTATNVDITNRFKPRRRPGRTLLLAGNYSNIWSDERIILAVRDSDLVKVEPDFSDDALLRRGVGNNRMSYDSVSDTVFYTNNQVIGYIKDDISYEFPAQTETHKHELFPGKFIVHYHDRLYIARENVIWFTDVLSQRFGAIDFRQNGRQLLSEIQFLAAVDDGLWTGDRQSIYYLAGNDPYTLRRDVKALYPALEGAVKKIDGKLLPEPIEGTVLAIATKKGICIAGNGGYFANVTEKTYNITEGLVGTVYFSQANSLNQIITVVRN